MAESSSFNLGVALGGLDLVLILGSDLYFAKKITELSVQIDALDNKVKHQIVGKSSSGYQESDLDDEVDDLYNRVEALENTMEKITDRQKRSEFLLNQIINALKDNNININIDAQQRRISSRRKHPTKVNKNPEEENDEDDDEDNKEDESDLALNLLKNSK